MSKETGGPAFPTPRYERGDMYSLGITLRDYFAATALPMFNGSVDFDWIAEKSYEMADAMLRAREAT